MIRTATISLLLVSCNAMPEFFKAAEDVMTDDCVTIKVDRDAFQKDTDVEISLKVTNKDPIK
jgi:starvation-inducible outer membrane lipoprotein